MSARTRIPRPTVTALTTAALLACSLALAGPAAADGYPQTPVLTDVLDAMYPMPEDLDDGYYSEQERIYGILGMGPAGGPYGEFPQPPNHDEPQYKGFPGFGPQGAVSDLTGVTPRPPGGDDENGRPARASVGPLLLPFCDSPEPCDLAPFVHDREPRPLDAEEVFTERMAGADQALTEVDWMSGLGLRKTLAEINPPAAATPGGAKLAADEDTAGPLLSAADDALAAAIPNEGPVNDLLMPVGDVLDVVDPTAADPEQDEGETLTAPPGRTPSPRSLPIRQPPARRSDLRSISQQGKYEEVAEAERQLRTGTRGGDQTHREGHWESRPVAAIR